MGVLFCCCCCCRHNQRVQTGLAPVEVTGGQDAFVHFGDVLQLAHAHTGAVLVTDVSDKVSSPLRGGVRSCRSIPDKVSSNYHQKDLNIAIAHLPFRGSAQTACLLLQPAVQQQHLTNRIQPSLPAHMV